MKLLSSLKTNWNDATHAQKIIYVNVVFFVLSILFFYQFQSREFQFPDYTVLSSLFFEKPYYLWTLLSYAFFHNGVLHLFFSMLTLHFIAPLFYTFYNDKHFLQLYFLSVLGGALVFLLLSFWSVNEYLLLGSSGAISALFFAVVGYVPNYEVRIPLVGSVKIWIVGGVFVLIDVLNISFNTFGHLAHLSGVVFGILFSYFVKNNYFRKQKSKPKHTFKKIYRTTREVLDSPAEKQDVNQKIVDEILDKISVSGYDSLSKEEKEFLFKMK